MLNFNDLIEHKSLHSYIEERFLHGPPHVATRGHPKENTFGRDWLLYVAVEVLRNLGFCPTRNRARRAESASSLLKKALATRGLGIGERTIENAWKRMDQLRRPSQ